MKLWTYGEMKQKVYDDLDLNDETFIKENELIGYFNEALNEAESEIMDLNEDYFLTKAYLPVVQGTSKYNLPYNIYANKIRAIIFSDGSQLYEVKRFRRMNKFLDIHATDLLDTQSEYMYNLVNDVPGQSQVEFHPTPRESAVMFGTTFRPWILAFIRNCARVPLLTELCNPEVIFAAQVDSTANTLATYAGQVGATVGVPHQAIAGAFPGSIAYITGDKVQVEAGPGSTLPAPLEAGTDYYVIAGASGSIKIATSRANAFSNTPIDLTTVGTGFFTLKVAATLAIINATIIDIPEFSTFVMQWVKCRCLDKEKSPSLKDATGVLVAQKKQMIETLENGVEDDDDVIPGDLSAYEDMN